MKRVIALVALGLVFGVSAGSYSSDLTKTTTEITRRRGCCSHHGGVCGCSTGTAKCCDGTLSPSCGCD